MTNIAVRFGEVTQERRECMARKPLKGIFPLMPLVLKKNQELDLQGLRDNIKAYEEAGFDGYVAFGCMGEFFATSEKDFNDIVDAAVDATGKIACIFGTMWHNSRECLRRTKYAEDAGADGAMVGAPYLIPCLEEDVYEHFRLVDDQVEDIQIMAYNNPFSFHFNMTPKFWEKLLKLESIKAVKESNGDAFYRMSVIKQIGRKINVFSGAEPWLLSDVLNGGNSLVSLCGPATAKGAKAYYQACIKRDFAKAVPLAHALFDMLLECTDYNEHAWLKAAAEVGGHKAGPPRSPYSPVSAEIIANLKKSIKTVESLA
jgi:4-hydroxy-tetrahydrodipicolinate synthase